MVLSLSFFINTTKGFKYKQDYLSEFSAHKSATTPSKNQTSLNPNKTYQAILGSRGHNDF
jgi:hypothetical protein